MSPDVDIDGGDRRDWVDWPAHENVLPIITATGAATGPLSRWSAGPPEQYLDSQKAGIIVTRHGQDQAGSSVNLGAAQSVKLPQVERMAPGMVRVTFPPPKARDRNAAEVERGNAVLVSGLAARAWEAGPGLGVLSEYCPASWHHPHGIQKILRRLEPRLPDVSGALFLTLTFDRNLFDGPASAHETGRPQIRKVMDKLRRGVTWSGKFYQIEAGYCVKVEFHADDWAHYHLVVLTRRYVPGELLNKLWGNGRCNVQRINNHRFRYLLKYVTKNGRYPAWVLGRRRLRVFQPSHGFMVSSEENALIERMPQMRRQHRKVKRASFTIGQRLHRWARMALYRQNTGLCSTILLTRPFRESFDVFVLSIAEDKRYLGNGFIKINQERELIPWILT